MDKAKEASQAYVETMAPLNTPYKILESIRRHFEMGYLASMMHRTQGLPDDAFTQHLQDLAKK